MAESLIIWLPEESDGPNERHRYVAHIAFEVILGCPYQWAKDETEWQHSKLRKIQYGGTSAARGEDSAIWIPSSGLLGLKGTQVPKWKWSDAATSATPGGSRLPFGVMHRGHEGSICDWWSWLFWMVTRLEEHELSVQERDRFGRIEGKKTWVYQEGWLERPEVECRVLAWAKYHEVGHSVGTYQVIPTIDVDSAFAYKHRSLFMTLAAAAQDLFKGRMHRFSERIRVLSGRQFDPYETYDWLESQHQNAGMVAIYFFLLADRGEYDRGIFWKSAGLQKQIRELRSQAKVGIHPGVASHDALGLDTMKREMARLKHIIDEPVTRSRQHYLLQNPGNSWRRLQSLGIKEDHSLGFADVPGFRAGMSRAFPAYDLKEEAIMNLELHPIAAMDATFMRYLKVSPDEAVEHVAKIASSVREVGGVLRLLWHNESVSDTGSWTGWRMMYQQMLQRVR